MEEAFMEELNTRKQAINFTEIVSIKIIRPNKKKSKNTKTYNEYNFEIRVEADNTGLGNKKVCSRPTNLYMK